MQEYGPANRLPPGLVVVILHLARPHLKYNLKIITRLMKHLFTTAAWTAKRDTSVVTKLVYYMYISPISRRRQSNDR